MDNYIFKKFEKDKINKIQKSENIEILKDLGIEMSVQLGKNKMKVQDILNLKPGDIVPLNHLANELFPLTIEGKIIAFGEIVVIDDCLSLRIREINTGGNKNNGS